MTPVRVGVVGLGAIAQSVHLPLLLRRWDLFEVVALADLSAARTQSVARRCGVAGTGRFGSLDELLTAREAGALDVDALLVATPGSHVPEVSSAVAAGLPVLSEKPLGFTVADLDALAEQIVGTGADPATRVMVGYMKEHDPATRQARLALEGASLREVTVEVLHPADAAQLRFAGLLPAPTDVDPALVERLHHQATVAVDEAVGAEAPQALRQQYTGLLLGSLIHDIALLRHLVGGVASIDHATHWGGAPGSIEVTGTVAGGARLRIGWHFIPEYPDYRETVTFHHETGTVRLRFPVPYVLNAPTELTIVCTAESGGARGERRAHHRWPQEEAFERQLEVFHDMVTAGNATRPGLAESRADVAVAQRILAVLAARGGARLGGEARTGRPGVCS